MKKNLFGLLAALALVAIMIILLILWPTEQSPTKTVHPIQLADYIQQTVTDQQVADIYRAVGTIKPSIESELEAKISAKILKVLVAPGQTVQAGQLLIELDDRDFAARLERAKQVVNAESAIHEQAKLTYQRMKNLRGPNFVSQSQLDDAKANLLATQAKVKQAERALQEAQVALSDTQIRSPAAGTVLDKLVDQGDQATPGKVLLKLQTEFTLQLHANIPEELINTIKRSQSLDVQIDAINRQVNGTVVEIVPNIDPKTRTFLAKVNLPQDKSIYPGMFGRLLIPHGSKTVIIIPKNFITRKGQLEYVYVYSNHQAVKTIITTGSEYENNVQVLSGLNVGDTIIMKKP